MGFSTAARCLGLACDTMPSRVPAYEARLSVRGDEPAFNEDGVDLTQIRHFLALTPLERLIWAEQTALEIEVLRSLARVKSRTHGKR
jgi:hypothetical protein